MRPSSLTVLAILVACSCAAATPEIPNLRRVRPRVMRSGDPPRESWPHLARLGVTDVIKLDYDDEWLDSGASPAGLRVHYTPLQPSTRLHLGVVEDMFAEPDRSTLQEISSLIEKIELLPTRTWLVHCSNGQDRTGLVVGMIRVVMDGWDKRRAWQEMLDTGYHPELLGLDRVWWDFQEKIQ